MAEYIAQIPSGQVTGTLSNMPLWVPFSIVKGGGLTSGEANSIRVYTDSSHTTEVPRAIHGTTGMFVKHNSVATGSEIFVDIDGVSSDYGIGDTFGQANVWSDKDAVYNLDNLVDQTSNGFDLTANGGVSAGGGANPEMIGSSDFDGSDDSMTNASTTTMDGVSSFTLSFIVTPDQDTARKAIVGKTDGASNATSSWVVEQRADKTLRLKAYQGTSQNISTDSNASFFAANTTVHADIVLSGTTLTFYKNGASHGSTTVTSTTVNSLTGKFGIGQFGTSAVLRFDGEIEHFVFTPAALTAAWITAKYKNISDPSTFWGTFSEVGGSPGTAYSQAVVIA